MEDFKDTVGGGVRVGWESGGPNYKPRMFASCSSYTGIQSMLREQNSGLLTVGHHQFDFTVATSWLVLLR